MFILWIFNTRNYHIEYCEFTLKITIEGGGAGATLNISLAENLVYVISFITKNKLLYI